MKYDDASWHSGGTFPANLPPEAAATHIGMYLAWCMLHGLAGELHTDDLADDLALLQARVLTPGQWLLRACDGKFTDEDVNDEGNAFTAAYFEADDMPYIDDYQTALSGELASIYNVPDTWESYDALVPLIDARFAAWQCP
jgi:hypothetical protein